MKVPPQEILREVRKATDDGQLSRLKLLTLRDISNVARDFHLCRSERAHANDATSVEAWVRSFDRDTNSPVILYKRQGDTSFDISPAIDLPPGHADDFMLAIMFDTASDMLLRFGTGDRSVICVDSTHGTNAYNIQLSTVMVLDSNREGYPVAFLFSTRVTEDAFLAFFEAIKFRTGCAIACSCFMSDMAPQMYNSWSRVMGDCNNRLYCSWHVDKRLKENIQKLIKDNSCQQLETYQTLKTLVVEHNTATFEALFPVFMTSLKSKSSTQAFAKYLTDHFVPCIKRWAYCYRVGCAVNTNMCLERMHCSLKYKYLSGKKNRRLDSAIKAVTSLVTDRQFERLTALCKGKVTAKLSELRKRHISSLDPAEVTSTFATSTGDGMSWLVKSERNELEFYTVCRLCDTCTCELKCIPCRACLHMFACSCFDNAIHYNMCKHIHTICQFLLSTHEENGGETSNLVVDETQSRRDDEASVHASVLVRARSATRCREDVRHHFSDLALLVNDESTDEADLQIILEGLRGIKNKLAAQKSSRFLQPQETWTRAPMEPANKSVEPQRKFKSCKKSRLSTRVTLQKPTDEEAEDIQMRLNKSLLLGKT